jgi:hypothetical protein
MGLDCSVTTSVQIVHWRPPSCQRQGRFRGPGRVPRGGVRQIGSAQHLPRAKKKGCSDARGALSVARRLPPLKIVFRGRGIVSRVFRCHSRKYMQIQAQYVHIPHIHTSTIIYVHLHTYTNLLAVGPLPTISSKPGWFSAPNWMLCVFFVAVILTPWCKPT